MLPVTVPVLVLWRSRVEVFPMSSQCLIILKYILYFLIEKENSNLLLAFLASDGPWRVLDTGGLPARFGSPALTRH